jgi:glutamine amidotransferase
VNVAILRYNAGNARSLELALRRLGLDPVLTDDPSTLREADRVLFPGVGEASTAMAYLRSRGLDQLIPELKQPFLGICLGLHLLCRSSEENEATGLGVFDLEVQRFRRGKVPHMGWNHVRGDDPVLFPPRADRGHAYFVHGYYAPLSPETIATCDYHVSFSAALRRDNFWAVQFHPEKSAGFGSGILRRFIDQ